MSVHVTPRRLSRDCLHPRPPRAAALGPDPGCGDWKTAVRGSGSRCADRVAGEPATLVPGWTGGACPSRPPAWAVHGRVPIAVGSLPPGTEPAQQRPEGTTLARGARSPRSLRSLSLRPPSCARRPRSRTIRRQPWLRGAAGRAVQLNADALPPGGALGGVSDPWAGRGTFPAAGAASRPVCPLLTSRSCLRVHRRRGPLKRGVVRVSVVGA